LERDGRDDSGSRRHARRELKQIAIVLWCGGRPEVIVQALDFCRECGAAHVDGRRPGDDRPRRTHAGCRRRRDPRRERAKCEHKQDSALRDQHVVPFVTARS
jgi:hypothetical protein